MVSKNHSTAAHRFDGIRVPAPRFLLLYPPLQFAPGEMAKPDGSLSLAYIAGSLRRAGDDVRIIDCAVGENGQPLDESFFHLISLPNGMRQVGLPVDSILSIAAEYDVIGVSSIFTPQTTPCLNLVRAIRAALPEKLVIAGGVNARNLRQRFFDSGVDVIALSEAEGTVLHIARALEGKESLTRIPGIAFRDDVSGREIINPPEHVTLELDTLPFPAWDLLPLRQYWAISRPHGGYFEPGATVRYASLQTSRGCPFHCLYCHISHEDEGTSTGPIGRFRAKSVERVVEELQILKGLGVECVFLEDDSLLAKKARAMQLLLMVKELGFEILDVNGVNLCHLLVRKNGRLDIDTDLIGTMAAAGFRLLTLPFESGSQRMIDKYGSGKWRIEQIDTKRLIRAFADAGIKVSGNYMIGYPGETVAEILATVKMARRHIEEGLDYAAFFTVVPFPGSELFDLAIREGHLDPDFDPDVMRWTKSIMRNLALEADALEHLRNVAWHAVNRPDYVDYKRGMALSEAVAERRLPAAPRTQAPPVVGRAL
jgi:anaerobic magnesium-protoporphyrin IX monomethyl ester cyclase